MLKYTTVNQGMTLTLCKTYPIRQVDENSTGPN